MCKSISLDELKEIYCSDEENEKSFSRSQSKEICILIGYLLGVKKEYLQIINDENPVDDIFEKLEKNENTKAIRHLNNIRSNIMLNFKTLSRETRITAAAFTPVYNHEILKDDFKALSRIGINISTGRQDLNEYIALVNKEISKRLAFIKPLLPEWVEYKHIVYMFNMPGDIKTEAERFQVNQNCYPYKRYFYWREPEELGNILSYDHKFLDVIYTNNHSVFYAADKVTDASEGVKNSISEFVQKGRKIQIFIDGENVDPYKFADAIESLQDYEIDKIEKIIVYYDNSFSVKAWTYLHHFTFDIPVEAIGVDRINENKSLVDHKLVARVSRAVYAENVDSIILVSSDSDFWSVIEDVKANYLVMLESEKCGFDFKSVLREHDIFYCYLDRFIAAEDDRYFKTVFRNEVISAVEKLFVIPDPQELFETALLQTRAEIPAAEKEAIFNKYIAGMKLRISKDKQFEIVVEE